MSLLDSQLHYVNQSWFCSFVVYTCHTLFGLFFETMDPAAFTEQQRALQHLRDLFQQRNKFLASSPTEQANFAQSTAESLFSRAESIAEVLICLLNQLKFNDLCPAVVYTPDLQQQFDKMVQTRKAMMDARMDFLKLHTEGAILAAMFPSIPNTLWDALAHISGFLSSHDLEGHLGEMERQYTTLLRKEAKRDAEVKAYIQKVEGEKKALIDQIHCYNNLLESINRDAQQLLLHTGAAKEAQRIMNDKALEIVAMASQQGLQLSAIEQLGQSIVQKVAAASASATRGR